MSRIFQDRADAGHQLAQRLLPYAGDRNLLVLALPRGGVAVAAEIARALGAPLDVMIVRKLGAPFQPELAIGAIASGNVRVLNEDLIRDLRISQSAVDDIVKSEQTELARRELEYRGSRPPLGIAGRTVIVVDDGIATGATMEAAVRAIRLLGPAKLVVAVPVATRSVCEHLREIADDVVCVSNDLSYSVGSSYQDFRQLDDADVRELLSAGSASAGT